MARQTSLRRWGFVAGVATVIFVASVLPPPATVGTRLGPFGFVGVDKWLHFGGYGLLAGALALALADGPHPDRTVAVLAATATVLYGGVIELLQIPIPRRGFDPFDLMTNGIGAILGIIGWWLVGYRRRPRPTDSGGDTESGSE